MTPLRNNCKRANEASIMICMVAVAEVVLAIADLAQSELSDKAASKEAVDMIRFAEGTLMGGLAGFIFVFAFVISCITFIRWFRRAYYNLGLRAGEMYFKNFWAALCWFVPLVNLLLPFFMMQELHEKAAEVIKAKGIEDKNAVKKNYVFVWFMLFVLTAQSIPSVQLGIFKLNFIENSQLRLAVAWTVFSAVFISFAVVTIRIIKNYALIETNKLR